MAIKSTIGVLKRDKKTQNADSAGSKYNPFPIETYHTPKDAPNKIVGITKPQEDKSETPKASTANPWGWAKNFLPNLPILPDNSSTPTTSPSTDPSTVTKPRENGVQDDGTVYFKTYDEMMNFIKDMQGQAGEGHDIFKNQMSSASRNTDDYAKFLQDIRNVIMNEARANPLETDWGKGILDYYGVLGDNSANAVNAATAGENAGNIDSFAAANAERQRVSKLGQGIESIMGMSTERFNNMLAGLESIGVNTERLFGAQGGLADTARQYATDLYTTDAQSTAAYNELMAALEGSGNTTINLDDNAVISKLKDVYSNLNIGDGENIDWTTTDKESWAEVIKTLKTNPNFSGLTDDYLYDLIAKIMKGQQPDITETNPVAAEDTIALSQLPAWIRNLIVVK